jgi:hypothetical protein
LVCFVSGFLVLFHFARQSSGCAHHRTEFTVPPEPESRVQRYLAVGSLQDVPPHLSGSERRCAAPEGRNAITE